MPDLALLSPVTEPGADVPAKPEAPRRSALTVIGCVALVVALAPFAVRLVAPAAYARGRYLAAHNRLGWDDPRRPIVEALEPRSWEDPWGNWPTWSDDAIWCNGPDGALGTPDDVRLATRAEVTWQPDGTFQGAGWWALLVAPAFAAPLAALLLGRGLCRRRLQTRALYLFVPPALFVWLIGEGARDHVARWAHQVAHAAPVLVPPPLAALLSLGFALWLPLVGIDLLVRRRAEGA